MYQMLANEDHLKLIPYLRLTCGECVEAIAKSSGTSLGSKSKVLVKCSISQNSVSIKSSASVLDLMHNSLSLDSM